MTTDFRYHINSKTGEKKIRLFPDFLPAFSLSHHYPFNHSVMIVMMPSYSVCFPSVSRGLMVIVTNFSVSFWVFCVDVVEAPQFFHCHVKEEDDVFTLFNSNHIRLIWFRFGDGFSVDVRSR